MGHLCLLNSFSFSTNPTIKLLNTRITQMFPFQPENNMLKALMEGDFHFSRFKVIAYNFIDELLSYL
jgi:hypothetical protein